jgi:hypothetical protein
METVWGLAPFFFWTRGILGSLLCGGLSQLHGTSSMEIGMCIGLGRGRGRGRGLMHRLSGCIG